MWRVLIVSLWGKCENLSENLLYLPQFVTCVTKLYLPTGPLASQLQRNGQSLYYLSTSHHPCRRAAFKGDERKFRRICYKIIWKCWENVRYLAICKGHNERYFLTVFITPFSVAMVKLLAAIYTKSRPSQFPSMTMFEELDWLFWLLKKCKKFFAFAKWYWYWQLYLYCLNASGVLSFFCFILFEKYATSLKKIIWSCVRHLVPPIYDSNTNVYIHPPRKRKQSRFSEVSRVSRNLLQLLRCTRLASGRIFSYFWFVFIWLSIINVDCLFCVHNYNLAQVTILIVCRVLLILGLSTTTQTCKVVNGGQNWAQHL